jgi:oligopeptide/dipeptide ABC transporter ATP-binding protein
MELTDRDTLYSQPMHPYTHALMSAVPVPDPAKESRRERILLTGDLPSPINPPPGCVFHTRCPKYRLRLDESEREHCRTVIPMLEAKGPDHFAACHFPEIRADVAVAEDLGAEVGEVATLDDVASQPADAGHGDAAGTQAASAGTDPARTDPAGLDPAGTDPAGWRGTHPGA